MKDFSIYTGKTTIFRGKSKDIHSHVPTKNTGKKYNIIWSLENKSSKFTYCEIIS